MISRDMILPREKKCFFSFFYCKKKKNHYHHTSIVCASSVQTNNTMCTVIIRRVFHSLILYKDTGRVRVCIFIRKSYIVYGIRNVFYVHNYQYY